MSTCGLLLEWSNMSTCGLLLEWSNMSTCGLLLEWSNMSTCTLLFSRVEQQSVPVDCCLESGLFSEQLPVD